MTNYMRVEWSRDQKVKVVTPLSSRRHISVTVPDERMITMDLP